MDNEEGLPVREERIMRTIIVYVGLTAVMLLCIARSTVAQITIILQPIPITPYPVNDWAKYGSPDLRGQGFTYIGQGAWEKAWGLQGGNAPVVPLTGNYVWPGAYYPIPQSIPPDDTRDSQSTAPLPTPDWLKPRADTLPAPATPNLRPSKFAAKAQAEKLMSAGDASFGKQQLSVALARYKEAVQKAPDLADTYLRQGFVLVAQRKYGAAVKFFNRSLELCPDWNESDVRLDQIHGEVRSQRTTDDLVKALDASPSDSRLAFVLGMQLFFTGNRERAEMSFERALLLGTDQDRQRLGAFLPKPKSIDGEKTR